MKNPAPRTCFSFDKRKETTVPNTERSHKMAKFGALRDGRTVELATIINNHGMKIEILNYGGILKSVEVPDSTGILANVVLGFDSLDGYVNENPYFGAIIGRFANRIAQGKFTLEDVTYQLTINRFPDCIHGGTSGFDKKLWDIELFCDDDSQGVRLSYRSPHGEEGFPGNLDTVVTYRLLNDENTLKIDYLAEVDRPTIINLTNHSYFNLAGEGAGSIEYHQLELNADYYLPLNADLVPTGIFAPVRGTPMDFTLPHAIGERLRQGTEQIIRGNGYDHTYVLNPDIEQAGVSFAARVTDPQSGRILEVWTSEPGLDFYTANFLDGSLMGPSGRAYRQGDAFALETEHFADSPNKSAFPSTVLRPGDIYNSSTEFRFGSLQVSSH